MNVQVIDNILIIQIVGAGLVSVRGRTRGPPLHIDLTLS